MTREIKIGNRMVGDGHPAYVIAEIGINHNGDLGIAKKMIDAVARDSYNKDGRAFKATCKALGIKHTYKSIRHYLLTGKAS